MDLRTQLKELARKHHVPGASVAILQDGEIETAVTGVVNRATRVTTTVDSLFQIGSITKVYTATLVMQLVDEGAVSLDEPVITYVPELDLGDEEAQRTITVRQLLTHTSGIDGDYFADFGRGDDAVERYIATLRDVGMIFGPGSLWSYSNAAYVLAGRVIEKVTGMAWDRALKEKLLDPAGLREHASLPEDAVLYRVAAGHVIRGKRKRPDRAPTWVLPRSTGPAGATLCATARDVLGFAYLHMNEGRAMNGTQVLSPGSVKAMQEVQFAFPAEPDHKMGIGWILWDRAGTKVIWHNGGTIGQLAYLYVVPERSFAICILTNSGNAGPLITDLTKDIFGERLDLPAPEIERLPDLPVSVDLNKYAGTFERRSVRIETTPKDGKLELMAHVSLLGETETDTMLLTPLSDSEFGVANAEGEIQAKVVFSDFDEAGRPSYVFVGRVARRTS